MCYPKPPTAMKEKVQIFVNDTCVGEAANTSLNIDRLALNRVGKGRIPRKAKKQLKKLALRPDQNAGEIWMEDPKEFSYTFPGVVFPPKP